MAGVAAHKVAAAHLNELPALEGPDGLEIPGHQPGNGGLARAGVAREDHVHGEAGGLKASRRPALLHLNVIRQTEDIFLDGCKAHQLVQLPFDLVHGACIGGRQQIKEPGGCCIPQLKVDAVRPGGESHGARQLFVGLQAVLAQGPENFIAAGSKPCRPLFGRAPGRDMIPDIRPGREGQAQPGLHFPGQRVELLGGQCRQILPCKGGGGADISQRRDECRAKMIGHCLPALVGKEDQVLAARVDAAHRARCQRRTGIHQDPLFVDKIAAAEGRAAFDGQVGDRLEEARVAAFVVLKDHDLTGGVQGRVQILQKEFFRPGVGVEGQIQRGDPIALEQAPGRHAAGRFRQGKVPPGARAAAQQHHIAGRRGFRAQHKGAAHGPRHALHKGVLPEDRLFYLIGQPLKAAQMLWLRVCRALGQQTVFFQIPQHFAAVFQRRLCGGVLPFQGRILLFEHFIQLFLPGQQGCVPIRQRAVLRFFRFLRFGLGRLRRALREFELAARAKHAVHQAFPIVGICHSCLRVCFFSV